jgi:hypothetical protein
MEENKMKTLTVIVATLCCVVVFVPFGLYSLKPHRDTSVVFIGVPPAGNNSVSARTLYTEKKLTALTFEFDSRFWAHFACFLASCEAMLIWAKVRCIYTEASPFTIDTVLSHGGVYTSNNEFWVFMWLHHMVLLLLTLNPISIHSLVVLVLVYVATISTICEPNNDHGYEDARSEIYTNRVMSLSGRALLLVCLITVDQRLNRTTFVASSDARNDALPLQLLIDTLLILAHASPEADILTCYMVRTAHTLASAVVLIFWLVVVS